MFRTALALFVALSCSTVLVGILPRASRFEVVAAPPVPAQLSQDARTYSVRGMVVNSATGDGIRGALVQTSLGGQRARLTGPDGRFEFDNVPGGQAWFNVQKPGYFAPQQITPWARQPTLTVGPDTPSMTLKLVPEGLIHGRISGDNGEPLESLQVYLLSERIEFGRKVHSDQRVLPTNDDGEFRFADLQPGKYFLFVGPSEGESFSAGSSEQRAQGYGSIFYSSASDLASAAAI